MVIKYVVILFSFVLVTSASCPDGWVSHRSSCYWFTKDRFSFHDAENYCQGQHAFGHLVQVDDSTENSFIKDTLKAMHGAHRWMGLTDEKEEGTWVWVGSNTPTNFTDWFPGQPNSNTGEEDCVIFTNYNGYRWYDVSCNSNYEPICEMPSSGPVVG
ncbi:perlucin-like protein isoform X2 [Mercenaria mercenaria]|uniref:perlucin-like protein isoform X2 n=1 Tax=Mercenaria mercenaria TaxID=6596 RepID=UPI00234ED956|nr:perlucin-like protein isoform X2 [Mercenaria mercenaria]